MLHKLPSHIYESIYKYLLMSSHVLESTLQFLDNYIFDAHHHQVQHCIHCYNYHIVESNISYNVIIKYGDPFYYNGKLLYYYYNNLYYYPFIYNDYLYMRAYRKPYTFPPKS